MDIIPANRVCAKTRQAQSAPKWIILGPYRYRWADWSEVLALCDQGWFCLRVGDTIITHYADIEWGRA